MKRCEYNLYRKIAQSFVRQQCKRPASYGRYCWQHKEAKP